MKAGQSAIVLLLAVLASAANAADTVRISPHCGSFCLYLSLKALDFDVESVTEIEERLGGPPPPIGYSMGQLIETAKSYGAHTLAVQTNFENLKRRPERFACIAHIGGNHFVNFGDVTDNHQVALFDPPRPRTMVPVDTLRSQWDGTALLISNTPLLAEENLPRPFPWAIVIGAALILLTLATGWVLMSQRRSWTSQGSNPVTP